MRLTKTDKRAFVRAVMNDVPKTDYESLAQKAFEKWFVTELPPKLAAVYADAQLKNALDKTWVYGFSRDYCLDRYQLCGNYIVAESIPQALHDELIKLADLHKAQQQSRNSLEEKLESAINSCSTLKVARKRLPEFEKYLPAERDGISNTANLPVIANLVADLVTAGWAPAQGV